MAHKLPFAGMPDLPKKTPGASGFLALLGLLLAAAAPSTVVASETAEGLATIPQTSLAALTSNATGETYRITVYSPAPVPAPAPTPGAESPARFPVIYVLDGLWHFARLDSLRSALVFDQTMPEVVVVAIDYPAPIPEVLKLRQKDLTLGTAAEPGPAGGAPDFLRFLTAELAPWVEARHPIDPTDRTLVGHSYAGHFALYAWAARPEFYRRILAGSPYWNAALERWLATEAPVPPAPAPLSRLDVSSGVAGLEYDDCVLTPERLGVIQAARARLGLGDATRAALYPDLKHAAIAHPIYAYGLPWLFSAAPGRTETLLWREGLEAPASPAP